MTDQLTNSWPRTVVEAFQTKWKPIYKTVKMRAETEFLFWSMSKQNIALQMTLKPTALEWF